MTDHSTWTVEEQEKIWESLEKLKDTDPEKYARIKASFEEKLKTNQTPPTDFSLPGADTDPLRKMKTHDRGRII